MYICHRASQDYVDNCYYYGCGVQEDNLEVVEWYTKAYKQGNAHAISQLERIYHNGYEVEVDKNKSFYYFKYAANRGNTYFQYFLHFFIWQMGNIRIMRKA